MGRLVPHRRAHELDLRRAGGDVPGQAGRNRVYAHEGWRKYFSLIGPIATFGYWFAWSSVLAIFGTTIGYLVQAEWAAGETWTVDAGAVDVGFPHVIGAICVILVWLVNISGIRPTMWMGRATALLLVIPIVVLGIIVYATGDWSSANLTDLHGPVGRLEARHRLALHHRLDRVRHRGGGELRSRSTRTRGATRPWR